MDLDDCFRKGLIKRTRIDEELIKSLKEMAGIKEAAVKTANLDEINISAYVSLAYDSLRETLEAICISIGYKVLSHICVGELLREKLRDFDYNEFDRLRYIRNGINYYGVKVEFSQGKEIIRKIFEMKASISGKHLSGFA
ncbi:MAG: hypothetical protein HY518_02810 [Candidatus Aenigmarchaeota archaeon]|nr:hypothetical protein [Candidatus Aenigmarchaeota archaeon]